MTLNEIKYNNSLTDFICKIKQWKQNTSPSRLCNKIICNVGFVERVLWSFVQKH